MPRTHFQQDRPEARRPVAREERAEKHVRFCIPGPASAPAQPSIKIKASKFALRQPDARRPPWTTSSQESSKPSLRHSQSAPTLVAVGLSSVGRSMEARTGFGPETKAPPQRFERPRAREEKVETKPKWWRPDVLRGKKKKAKEDRQGGSWDEFKGDYGLKVRRRVYVYV